MNAGPEDDGAGRRLSPEQIRSRRARNIAIGLALGSLVVLLFFVTMAKLGLGVLNKGL